MPEPTELRVRMLAMLSGLTRETTLYANEEYVLPRATAERYFDHGIAEIVDPKWEKRPARGNDEQQAIARSRGELAVEPNETETRAEPEPETLTPGPSPAAAVAAGEGGDADADAVAAGEGSDADADAVEHAVSEPAVSGAAKTTRSRAKKETP